MHKKNLTSLFALLATLATAPALLFAGGPGVFGTYIDTDDLGDSYGVGARLDLNITDNFVIQARSAFYDTLGQDLTFANNNLMADLEIVPVEVGLAFDLSIADRLVPYIGGGAGWYILEAEVMANGQPQELNLDDELGFYILGGLRLDLGHVALFGEYQYRRVDTALEGDSFGSRVRGSVDVGLSGSSINAGIMLRW